jgi:hypothetical protein
MRIVSAAKALEEPTHINKSAAPVMRLSKPALRGLHSTACVIFFSFELADGPKDTASAGPEEYFNLDMD